MRTFNLVTSFLPFPSELVCLIAIRGAIDLGDRKLVCGYLLVRLLGGWNRHARCIAEFVLDLERQVLGRKTLQKVNA